MAKRTKKRRYAATRNPAAKHARSRNPMVGHASSASGMAKSVVGGLIGVTLTKMATGAITGIIPATGLLRAAASIGAAFAVGKLVSSVDRDFGAAAAFGGYMQAGSEAISILAPSIGNQIGLKGLGVWMPSAFSVPENTIMQGINTMAPAPVTGISGFRRRF